MQGNRTVRDDDLRLLKRGRPDEAAFPARIAVVDGTPVVHRLMLSPRCDPCPATPVLGGAVRRD